VNLVDELRHRQLRQQLALFDVIADVDIALGDIAGGAGLADPAKYTFGPDKLSAQYRLVQLLGADGAVLPTWRYPKPRFNRP
jgi:hypothetical protein